MSNDPSVGCCVIARGRHEHLERVLVGLARQRHRPDVVCVVSMGDPDVCEIAARQPLPVRTDLVTAEHPLPLAMARNRAADLVATDVIVFLDVDCIPAPRLVEDYVDNARDGLLTGTVRYLPPGVPSSVAAWTAGDLRQAGRCHKARPPVDDVQQSDRYDLFWSLNFAVTSETWAALGGFDELFVGYGAEDTDLAFRARAADVPLWRVPGGEAFHQHHDSENPPTAHLVDIIRNANHFHRRWGTWPMRGWLDAFERDGLLSIDDDMLRLTAEEDR